jgi:hypothetical protein
MKREPGSTLPIVCGAPLGGDRRCEQAPVVAGDSLSAACPIESHRAESFVDLTPPEPISLSSAGFVCIWDGKRNLATQREREPHADRVR